jgi:hypothetical protein
VKADMESRGWYCWRVAGSHSPADLICAKAGEPLCLVQVKANGHISPRERRLLVSVADLLAAEGILASRPGRKLVYAPADGSKVL